MPFSLFVFLGIFALVIIIGWPKRRDDEQHWHERQGIEPMSKEDIRINEILKERRK